MTGVLRDFSKNARELRKAYDTSRARMEQLPRVVILDRSRALMNVRVERMARLYADFEDETGGLF